jgi:hypothetical protein
MSSTENWQKETQELKDQIAILKLERDAACEESEELRRRLHLVTKDNQRLREVLLEVGEKLLQEGDRLL